MAGRGIRQVEADDPKLVCFRGVTVTIFSDSEGVLTALKKSQYEAINPRRSALNKVLCKINEESRKLGQIPNMPVKLELFWIPAHVQAIDYHESELLYGRRTPDGHRSLRQHWSGAAGLS